MEDKSLTIFLTSTFLYDDLVTRNSIIMDLMTIDEHDLSKIQKLEVISTGIDRGVIHVYKEVFTEVYKEEPKTVTKVDKETFMKSPYYFGDAMEDDGK